MTLIINGEVQSPPKLVYRVATSRLGATGESEFGPFVGSKYPEPFPHARL